MPVNVHWYDITKTVLVIRFTGDWTYEEMAILGEYIRALQATVDHDVINLVDMREMNGFPPMIAENSAMIMEEPYRNVELSIVVGNRDYFDQIIGITASIGGFEFDVDYAETLEEALAMIQRRHVP